jgi:hypothetical protein
LGLIRREKAAHTAMSPRVSHRGDVLLCATDATSLYFSARFGLGQKKVHIMVSTFHDIRFFTIRFRFLCLPYCQKKLVEPETISLYEMASAFALSVTTRDVSGEGWIAKNGQYSLFRAFYGILLQVLHFDQ